VVNSAKSPRHLQAQLFHIETGEFKARPFLKWAGGKTRLLGDLRRCIPRKFVRYFEPFLGGGALFFDLQPPRACLSDSNPELIHCFQVVANQPEELIEYLETLEVTEDDYYRMRATLPEHLADVPRAGRFIYLNKTCFNGLYRVNKRGLFNTPYGRNESVSVLDPQNLRRASEALRGVQLTCSDYAAVLDSAKKGDFIYLDPPYLPIGKYSDFKRYTKDFFYEADHTALAENMRILHRRGCLVLLSNSFHSKIQMLYKEFSQIVVEAPRFVNCKGDGRGKVREVLIANYPIPVSE
jgi:DNA adenine methylase